MRRQATRSFTSPGKSIMAVTPPAGAHSTFEAPPDEGKRSSPLLSSGLEMRTRGTPMPVTPEREGRKR